MIFPEQIKFHYFFVCVLLPCESDGVFLKGQWIWPVWFKTVLPRWTELTSTLFFTVKPPIRVCGITMRSFPPLCLFYSGILFLIHSVIFRLDWKLHCSVLTAGEWTHWKTFESTLSTKHCRWVLWMPLSGEWVNGGEQIVNTSPIPSCGIFIRVIFLVLIN